MQARKLLFILLLLTGLKAAAQPELLLTQWHDKAPIEKVYLHTDRDQYLAGDTIWFKAYLSADYLPDTGSSVLLVSLNDASGKTLFKARLPIVLGISNGQLPLPTSLFSGRYTLTAFTPTLLNNGPDFIYKKPIEVYGKNPDDKKQAAEKNKQEPAVIKKDKTTEENIDSKFKIQNSKLTVAFFPEGGNFITGLSNTIAFKATNEYGEPVNVHGAVYSSKNGRLSDLTTVHDGMGFFELQPSAGETFYVLTDADPDLKKTLQPATSAEQLRFDLPLPSAKGSAISIIPHPEGSYFELHTNTEDGGMKPAYMLGQMQHRVVFRQDFNAAKSEWQGVLKTRNLHSGILQITVFNAKGLPLAERLVFVNNKEYIQPADLITDTLSFARMAKNRFRIAFPDTIQGNFSVSVTDAQYEANPERTDNIFSTLFMTSDLRGYIHDPAWYFRNEGDSVTLAADLLMMTNGWRRFKWNELEKQVNSPLPYADPAFITLSGRVFLRGTRKPVANKPLILLLTSGGHLMNTQTIFSDDRGYFKSDSLIFYGSARAFIIEPKNRKSNYIEVEIDSLTKNSYLLPLTSYLLPSASMPLTPFLRKQLDMDYDAILKAEGLMLEGVTVKGVKLTPSQQVEEKYTHGAFATDAFAEKTLDLINTNDIVVQDNIFEYLRSKVPGLQVVEPDYTFAGVPDPDPRYDVTKYRLFYRQQVSLSSQGNPAMTVYLNEVETDASVVEAIPASEIALIKIFSSFAMATGGGPGGAIAIYTKKDLDMPSTSKGNIFSTTGFSVIKEFYAPDYKEVPNALFSRPDNRITLDWRPNTFFNAVSPKIPFSFYNNDRTKKFRVVVEGMTTTGKLICVDRVVE